ncbi:MAG: TrmH family RNA methyltransferase [Bacteroidia bacterium]
MISKNQIKRIRALHQKKFRDEEQVFIVEGVKSVLEVINSNSDIIKELYSTEHFSQEHTFKNISSSYIVSGKELEQISLLKTPNEVLAVCSYLPKISNQLNFDNEFAFFLDNIRDPGNLGTIIRICSWFGIKNLYCSPGTVDVYNPKCIQACMGSFLRVNITYSDIHSIIQTNNIRNIFAADLEGESIFNAKSINGLIVIGNEANGISDEVKKICTNRLTIPGANTETESLNAALSCGIIAAEIFRRR